MPRTIAKKVILDILRVGEGEWSGKVKLHKAFYFAHLYYANERPGFLTDLAYCQAVAWTRNSRG